MEGAALFWYLRNQFYFELELHKDPRVLLVNYEEVAENPEERFERIFSFIGSRFDLDFVSRVFGSSVKKARFPAIAPEIQRLCGELLARFDEQYASRGR